ncbi:stage II sporulation protein R [Paenibacillus sp. GSMTC-2017]|uniref:stage II sporulation protein R n=1 Tax=Paenibacillus sp. GSMTC-2017 TaxID=2794350 RepID=UPI0018D68116|nr:stage II sporulation protein R [Paenibacillus sp. GSMTC-2017]MBH5320544.1 stage II sporulation protein R [Paenibacillus sp. GSMTC-2017]
MSNYYTSSHYSVRPYRYPYRKSYGFILMAIIVLIMSWESAQIDAAVAGGNIPEEAIRLRILANSDSASDQLIKRVVRDEIVKTMNSWATGPVTIEEARETIQNNMPDIERVVSNVLKSRGYTYTFTAELGMVDFPTKMYGNKVYPAGLYEALLVTIGEGKGQNWWCVLFPPLCFIDATTGEASAASVDSTITEEKPKAEKDASDKAQVEKASADNDESKGKTPETKFFIWEFIKSIIDWFKSLF